ncbi:hypothetical protein OH786_03655 [Streptomyces atratus]|uniref:Uncharacterized protein n=1 Tax=Streptomyces atratus TaxID=1893 RepID=A0A1K2C9C9_STRAR|nr:hypothetical protein [Streptomyces atratus]SFY06805.1 hypothetical protein SAMN02787144_1010102 [Streptomyces atratus]
MYQQPNQPQQYRHVEKRGANHGLHIVLTILTCGLWAITGWPIAAAMGRKTTSTTYAPAPPVYPQQPQGYAPPPQQPYQQPYGYPPQQQQPPRGGYHGPQG